MSDIEKMRSEILLLKEKAKNKSISPAERLRLRRLQLELDELKLAVRSAKNSAALRKIETRQKVILGSWVIHISSDSRMQGLMRDSLVKFLEEKDRAFLEDFLLSKGVIDGNNVEFD